jgi:hypothetical protein
VGKKTGGEAGQQTFHALLRNVRLKKINRVWLRKLQTTPAESPWSDQQMNHHTLMRAVGKPFQDR